MYHYAIKIEDQLREENEHSKRSISKANTFSNYNAWNNDGLVNRNEAKGKIGTAKREVESSNSKRMRFQRK